MIGSATWNDEMYLKHPTPYGKSLAGFVQSQRVGRVLKYAEISTADAVLEIGCEGGRLLAAIPDCRRLVGCDISAEALRHARELLGSQGRPAELLLADALRPLPFQRGEFDVIVCSEMLEHVVVPKAVISNIAELCTEQTRVVLTVPIEAPKVLVKRWLYRLGFLRFLFPGIEPGQSEWHLQSFSRKLIRHLTAPAFTCDRASTVWGCHFVGLFRRSSALVAR